MDEGMDTLPNEVETFGLLLIIKELELEDPLEQVLVSESKLFGGNPTLVHDTNANDKLAVVLIVRLWK